MAKLVRQLFVFEPQFRYILSKVHVGGVCDEQARVDRLR